ncbi:FAD-dependent monooxygenase [Streptomyces sp. NBC_00237]|uniref:NAD(P)/FAD-dependent oxidoreductase n=1 Tax=Streptomyces sp. NBC_00237 TaxID=2975687 RepID=UPI002255378F|nr:FAD-dependent monooxygenase [Streptomyces sp. NBC_00237]MCX5205671.1 FAD-dependent monooxygenase [Streptomyces sp. NBC_00237]
MERTEMSECRQAKFAGQAVVVGAGIAGLVAARVLADHFESVVVLEAAALPSTPTPRSGVAQARHQHGLLISGASELQRLFPGLREELTADGAPLFDFGSRASMTVAGCRLPRRPMDVVVQAFSRDLLEWRLRQRVTADTSVDVRDRSRVKALCWDDGGARVVGVRLEDGRMLDASLVVDSSGRFSPLPDWLGDAGYPRPAQQVTDADLVYATRTVAAPTQDFDALFQPYEAPEQPRGGFAARLEHGNWLVTLFGAGGDHPPVDPDGWRQFAASLHNPDLDQLLAGATPVPGGRIHVFRRTENRLTRYDRMRKWPEGLIALGDSVGAFNPAFGQGMATAVLEARVLSDHLARVRRGRSRRTDGLARSFQQDIGRIARKQWLMTASDDLVWQYRRQRKRLPLWLRPVPWYKGRLLRIMVNDPRLHTLFIHVFHMVKPVAALAGPRILAKVLFSSRGPDARDGVTGQRPARRADAKV